MAKKDVSSQDIYATSNAFNGNVEVSSDASASEDFGIPEGFSPSYDKPAPDRSSRRVIKSGNRIVARHNQTTPGVTTEGIPEHLHEDGGEILSTLPGNNDPRGVASFTASGPGLTDLRQSIPGKLGLTCDVPGNSYQHGPGGSEGPHFMSSAKDNPFTTTPYVLCKHHLQLKQIQHQADPDIRFDPIKPQDIEKHKARLQAMKDSATGTMESSLLTGGYYFPGSSDSPTPPRSVTLPPADVLWGHETGGPAAGRRGASLRGPLFDVKKRRSNLEQEDLLNRALENLRSTSDITPEEHDEHMETYHSPGASKDLKDCPICSAIYTRTVENAAKDAPTPQGYSSYSGFSLKGKNSAGVLRRPGWAEGDDAPDVRNASGPVPERPKRVGQSLPSEAATRESVPYGSEAEWAKQTLPAHMIVNDEFTGARAATPLEKFAEERLTKQVGEQGTAISNVEALTAARLREIESVKKMSPREQLAYGRSRKAFNESAGRPELESGNE